MDESGEIIDNFATILQQQSSKRPTSLYRDVNLGNTSDTSTVVARDVFSNVAKQILQLQSGQSGAKGKTTYLNTNKLLKSSLVPVNIMEEKNMPQRQLQIVDQAEEAACIGVTQEFEMSFDQEHSADLPNVNNEKRKDSPFQIIDISLKEPDPNKIIEPPTRKDNFKSKFDSQFDNCTQILNECIEIENIDQFDIFVEDIEAEKDILTQNTQKRSRSPVFSVKSSKTKSKPQSPLVYNLETFEKFEKIASSLVDDSMDKDTAKQLINSQIFGKELFLQTDGAPFLEENERISPVIELNTDSFKINHRFLQEMRNIDTEQHLNDKSDTADKEIIHNDSKTSKRFGSVEFEDEILFSSDEEDDRSYKSFKDLPFTCALETSFYDEESQILDKTMFVGFQTASNKSILVQTDSFSKAKNLFDDVDKSLRKTVSVTELVQLKDESNNNKSTNINKVCKNDANIVEAANSSKKSITLSNQDANIDPESTPLNGHDSDSKDKYINADSKNICDSVAKPLIIESHCLDVVPNVTQVSDTNSINNDKMKSQRDTEDIHKLDDEVLLEFQDEMMSHKDLNSKPINKRSSDAQLKLNKIEFTTASNKSIIISDAALEKSKKILPDIDCDMKQILEKNKDVNFEANINQVEFTTASYKKIKISDKALKRIKSVFHDIDLKKLPEEKSDCEVFGDIVTGAEICGFKTAGYKEPLVKANSIFQDYKQDSDNIVENIKIDAKRSAYHKNDSENITVCDEDTSDPDKEPPFLGFDHNKEDKVLLQEIFRTSQKIFEKLDDCGNSNHEDQTRIQELECLSIKLDKTIAFEGFKTASNKKVIVSAKALEKSRNLFQDLERQTSVENYSEDNLATHGKRMSTQDLHESDEHYVKRRKLCNDFTAEKKTASFLRCQTASNKLIQVSEKSRKLLRDINHEMSPVKSDVVPDFKGFQTASFKTIEVSEQALKKSKTLFQDIDYERNFETTPAESIEIPKFIGFQTASNKQVEVSEKALERSRKLFQDIHKDNIMETFSGDAARIAFESFYTASNKPVTISENSLAYEHAESKDRDIRKPFEFKGFQTASNKHIKVSAESLEKSRKSLQDVGADILIKSYPKNIDKVPIFQGFQTASNKQVKISEKALEKSRKIFQDLDASTEPNQKQLEDVQKIKEFQISSTTEVKISETALEKNKKFLDDQIFLETNIFGGFQTANNKKSKISEKALARTQKIFQNISDPDCEDNLPTNVTKLDNAKPKFGFMSANNKKVDISKDALLQSKALLQNLNEDKCVSSTKQSNSESNTDEVFEINTEVIKDFETTFKETTFKREDTTPKKSKRSGSPILSCPKAKKRKVFKTPYSQKANQKEPANPPSFKPPNTDKESQNAITFSSNYKKFKNYTLKDVKKIESESNSDQNIDQFILRFDFENLLSFEFSDVRNDITDSKMTVADLKNLFQNSVDRKLIPEGWLDIQLKLIIWKLVSYEITFPKTMNLTCTAKNVMDQLKYRYDKELYNAERPILRKIMEKDDVSTRAMVLCVVGISGGDDSSIPPELTLTDGWYTIKVLIDKMLSKYVSVGKIKVGCKLLTHGAELVGSEQAVSPWEDTSSIRLKLFGNSTRRARWDARLGCHGNAAILSHLSNVTVEGGKVPKLRVVVSRVYPPLYVDKFEDGSTVTRSERLEHLHQMKHEAERQVILDKIYEEAEKEAEKEVDQDSEGFESSGGSHRKINQMDTESRIAKIMKRGTDTQFLSQLTSSQKEQLEEYNEKRREKIMSAIQCKVQDKMAACGMNLNRNVVTVLKIRVVDIEDRRDSVKVTKAMLSIWRPNEAITEVIKENSWIEILNVTPTAFRYAELQLSAGRQTIFSQSKHKQNNKIQPYTLSLKRICYPIKELVNNPTMITDYNEIDTIGIVFQTNPATKDFEASKQQFQNVYLADIDKNMISINFWGGLRKFGFENCLDTGQIVAGINLQKRAGNTRKSIPQYRVMEFSYFTTTPKHDNARKMTEELSYALSKIDRKTFFEDCIRIKDGNFIRLQCNENISPYRFPIVDINSSKITMFLNTPVAQKRNDKDENLHLTGLDFKSTFKQEESQDYPSKTLLRKRQVEQKMAKLKMYGEPPALSPIQIINKSKNAAKAYKSPLITKCDVSHGVVSKEENIPNQQNSFKHEVTDIVDCSPVICINRTYVKKCDAKPVKLNFSKNEKSYNDDFAEEFDCSPPLSLD